MSEMTSGLVERASEMAVEAITLEHGPLKYAEQAKAGNWPIFRCAQMAALIALRPPLPAPPAPAKDTI